MEPSNKCLRVVLFVVFGSLLVGMVVADDFVDQMTSVASRAMQECEHNSDATALSAVDCLKSKALRAMDRALKAGPLSIGDGLTLVRRPAPRDARALPLVGESTSPNMLDDLLAGRAERLLETRALQMPLSALLGMNQEVGFTGRKKLKKMAGPAILIIVMAAYKLAMLMAGIAMLSGKALIVSKVALTLAGVAILKKLLSHGDGHEKTTVEIVKTPQVSHSHSYSHHDHHDDYGHHDKSWTVPSPSAHYSHRSSAHEIANEPMDYTSGPADSSEGMVPMYSTNRRSFKMAGPSTIDAVRISGRAPLRVVLASPSVLEDEPPMSEEYLQFGTPDTGAWRGFESTGNVSAGSEYTERAGKGEMLQPTNTEYHPRSL